MKKALMLAAALAALSGCATTPDECDPSVDPGFLDKLGCTVSGSYGERVAQKEREVTNLWAEQEEVRKMSASLEESRALVEADLSARRAELDGINARVGDLERRLREKRAMGAYLQRRIDDVYEQLREMQDTPANAVLLQKQQERDELRRRLDELAAALAG